MKRPLEVGDRVSYPGDPRDLGTVVEVHEVVRRPASRPKVAHVQVVILWDRGQHDHDHMDRSVDGLDGWPTCTVPEGTGCASWKRHPCVLPDLDEARADTGLLVTVDGGKVRRLRQRVGVIAAERDLARAMRRLG